MTKDAGVDLLQGTLDMLVLKAVSLGPLAAGRDVIGAILNIVPEQL